jgi:hypothetical protein
VLKNKHQAVSQGIMSSKLKARSSKEKILYAHLSPSSFELSHLQKPHNAGSRPPAQFFNTLLKANRQTTLWVLCEKR